MNHIQHLMEIGRIDQAKREVARGLSANPEDQRLLDIQDALKVKEEEQAEARKKRVEDERARSRQRVDEAKKIRLKNTRLNHIRAMTERQRYDIAERELSGLLRQFPGDEDLIALQNELKQLSPK